MHAIDPPRDGAEVLYVEDQDINVLLMQTVFDRHAPALGLRVAVDVRSALALAPTIRPALLLLDLNLPDGHGVALLARLRDFDHLRNVPAIAVTAEPRFEAAGSGFAEVWRKPINPQRTHARLDHWLTRREAPCAPTSHEGRASVQPDCRALLEP